jgi:hypothetical protein
MKTLLLAGASLAVLSASAFAAAFTAGDIVVDETESGATLTSAATAVDLAEYSPTGTLVQSIAMPTTASGPNAIFTDSGSAGSDGLLTLSPNGEYLALAGYDATVGASSVVSSGSNRTVAIVNGAGQVDTSTVLSGISGNNIRSAVTTDGNSIWISGTASGLGVDYTTDGTVGTPVELSASNTEEVSVYNSQLYASSQHAFELATVGTGLPTSSLQAETALPGLNSTSSNIYEFYLTNLGGGSNPDTLYLAESSSSSAGQIQKWSLETGTWVETGDVTLGGAVGLTGEDVNGTVDLFATTATKLYSLTDTSGFEGTLNGTLDNIATVANSSDDQFKGVAFAPQSVPEPSTWAAMLSGFAALAVYQSRRRGSRALSA